MILVAFAVGALVTYALVLAALNATSVLSHDHQDDVADDPRDDPGVAPDRSAGAHLAPCAPAGNHRILDGDFPVDVEPTKHHVVAGS